MAIQDFTAGQVLTAAQMDSLQANDYNWTVSTKTASYVLTATDKGTRVVMNSASATTITVNTSLFAAGDTLYLQNIGAGVCTVTAGTATVTSAGSLAIPQWGSGTLYFTSASAAVYFPSAATTTNPALVCVKAETAFSAASSVTADSVFTSSYTNYLINVVFTSSATTGDLFIKLRVGGVSASTNYNFNYISWTTTVTAAQQLSQTSFSIADDAAATSSAQVTLFGPQLAAATGIQSQSIRNLATNDPRGVIYTGNHSTATAYDGIEILTTGTMTGTYTIYGYSKTV